MTTLTHPRLFELLKYDRQSGLFTWRVHRGPNAPAGSMAGYDQNNGYRAICVDKKKYLMHRLAWFYCTGRWPPFDIDHKDGNRKNNAFTNLRKATRSENLCNGAMRSNNTSGVRGVSWDKRAGAWHAYVALGGRRRHLGYYADLDEAKAAREAGAKLLQGEFAAEVCRV